MPDARVTELQSLLPRCLLPDWVRLGSRLVRLLRDQHHPARHSALLDRLLAQARASVALHEVRRQNVPRVTYPAALPITARKDEIVAAIRGNQVVVLAGETGSGKTTQIPKMCLEAGLGIEAKIGCTQPRRVAALSISRRIAEELDVRWGEEVGCKIRFDDRSSPHTYIKLMTDGILLAETQGDPTLADYNALILDEAHERSLNIDFLLGYLKGLLAKRQELKLIVTSATIDTEAFSRHFDDAPIIEVSGRMYPVEVVYAPFVEEEEEEENRDRHSDVPAGHRTAPGDGTAALTRAAVTEPSSEAAQLALTLRSELASLATERDLTYVDAAVEAADRVIYDTSFGDLLVFMPGERDIRETSDQLEGRFSGGVEVIPLFGRLSAGDQQRVFSASSRRKVVVATNIAETSLTIPGIRFVIDAGLARLSRYNPRTRTRRLPIERISQSSANQRKGRAGRVQDGICIRLFSEEDFADRPAFTQPEIQRANLAEVILRMKAFHLGDIETFPFLQPPTPGAIAGGYALLQELGALDGQRELTPLGRDLARLPIDPTLGRMLLQSQREHATRELLIIAAGLSIQDPRERPLDRKDAADAAHKRFTDPQSDFLTLLNLWNAVHDEWEKQRTQGQRRRFCKAHFLSYLRMREWQDLHEQLEGSLEDLDVLREAEAARNGASAERRQLEPQPTAALSRDAAPRYDAIHRSILSGLIGHVARREERNLYASPGNRKVMPFPGSALFARGEPPRKPAQRGAKPPPAPKQTQPEWIVAGEIVETSQLFARTLAGIDPQWIYQLAPHCCKVAHVNPHWSAAAGRVVAEEVITLSGLEVQRRKVAYGNINPKEATAIFIRSALVEEDMQPPEKAPRNVEEEIREAMKVPVHSGASAERRPSAPRRDAALSRDAATSQFPFLVRNHAVREKIESWQTRLRRFDLGDLDQALFDFYAKRIEGVSSLPELSRLVHEQADPNFLCLTEADLVGSRDLAYDTQAFPDAVPVGGQPVALCYAYAPGEEHDGVTIRLPFTLAQTASAALLEWSVPGLREEKVGALLRALPKSLRRDLMPLPPKVAEIVREFQPSGHSLLHELARFLHQRYGVPVKAESWPADALPAHLRARIELVDGDEKTIHASRDLDELRQHIAKAEVKSEPTVEPAAWQRVAAQWERFSLTTWSVGDLPERITVSEGTGLPLYAWAALVVEDGNVNLRLVRSADLAREASLAGVQRLVELALQKDLGWIEKDLRALMQFQQLYAPLGTVDELRESALVNVKRHLLPAEPFPALAAAHFNAAVEAARKRLPGLASQMHDRIGAILQLRQQVEQRVGRAAPAPVVAAAPKPKTLTGFAQLAGPPPPAPRATHPLAAELLALVPPRFPERVPFERLPHLPRYLKALLTRAERAALNPQKDRERAAQLAPYVEALRPWREQPPRSLAGRRELESFAWMVEEFKVSLFAQELGTAIPVSPKRLDEQLSRVREAG